MTVIARKSCPHFNLNDSHNQGAIVAYNINKLMELRSLNAVQKIIVLKNWLQKLNKNFTQDKDKSTYIVKAVKDFLSIINKYSKKEAFSKEECTHIQQMMPAVLESSKCVVEFLFYINCDFFSLISITSIHTYSLFMFKCHNLCV